MNKCKLNGKADGEVQTITYNQENVKKANAKKRYDVYKTSKTCEQFNALWNNLPPEWKGKSSSSADFIFDQKNKYVRFDNPAHQEWYDKCIKKR